MLVFNGLFGVGCVINSFEYFEIFFFILKSIEIFREVVVSGVES